MSLKTVLVLMAFTALVLGAFTMRLHEHVMTADEPQARHACRSLCKLGMVGFAEDSLGGAAGDLARALAGRACEAMDDATPILLECRDRLLAAPISVADYRCVIGAKTEGEAHACSTALE